MTEGISPESTGTTAVAAAEEQQSLAYLIDPDMGMTTEECDWLTEESVATLDAFLEALLSGDILAADDDRDPLAVAERYIREHGHGPRRAHERALGALRSIRDAGAESG